MSTKKIWFVTGASKGLGLSLVKELLHNGYRVAATSRSVAGLQKEIGNNENFLALETDIVDEASVQNAIAATLNTFGNIDVVVNNAGYGQLGTVEELTDKEARENFDANVFGTLNVMRAVMPHLRSNHAGHIINIASIGGFTGEFAGWGIYCATKFAMAGFTEAFAAEAKEFGIKATVVYPGYFRTEFLSGGSLRTPAAEIKEYTEARKLQALHEEAINGTQPGDPDKAAKALVTVAEMNDAPLHLFLGSDAFNIAHNKINLLEQALQQNEAISKSTDF